MTQANTALEPKRHGEDARRQAARAARPNGGAAAAARVDPASFRDAILAKLTYAIGKDPSAARDHDWFAATALAVRDRVVDRWMDVDPRDLSRAAQKRVYYLSLEFLIGRLMRDALGNLGLHRHAARGAGRARRRLRPDRARSSPTRRSATAASAGSPPASWRAWRPSGCRLTATASATSTACSARRSSTAGRPSCPRTGSPRQSLGVRAPRGRLRRSASAAGRVRWRRRRPRAPRLAARPRRCSATAYDTPVVGWRGAPGQHASALDGRAADPLQLDAFNAATMSARSPSRTAPRRSSRVLYPADATPAGPGAAAAAGVFLHLGLAAGPPAAAHAAVRHARQPRRQGRRSSSTTPIRRSRSPS